MRNIDVSFINPYNNCILRKIIYHQYLPMLIGISDSLGAQTDRLRCEVCQNLILSPMNTGVLRPAVATALTVYGIETLFYESRNKKLYLGVATALTVYGIETFKFFVVLHTINHSVATALTVYGIETCMIHTQNLHQ